jgi:hypothetical protein
VTFQEGTGDEFILTCFVCKNPFGLVAQFCGFCQATRQQALGIERSRTNQFIVAEPIKPTHQEKLPTLEEVVKPPKIRKQSFFLQNMRLRIDNLSEFFQSKSRPILASAVLGFSASAYILIQTYMFISYSPTTFAEDFMYKGVTRQVEYFKIAPPKSGVSEVFPVRFMKNQAASTGAWNTNATWNGWLGKSKVVFSPRGVDDSSLIVSGEFKPTYTRVMKIFRKTNWYPSGPAATIKLDYPRGADLAIYINGKSAGTTRNPIVPPGTYMSYPGEIEISFYSISTGRNISKYEKVFNVGTSGTFQTNF